MSFELDEDYPLKPEAIIPATDLSKGLRRSMPIEYDRTGRYRNQPRALPYLPCLLLLAGSFMLAKVWL